MGKTILIVEDEKEGERFIKDMLRNGDGLNKFSELIEAQGGNKEIIDDYSILPKSSFSIDVTSLEGGYISSIKSEILGELSVELGAGRMKKEDDIDFGAGIFIPKKIGDFVESGELIGKLYTSKSDISHEDLIDNYRKAFSLSKDKKIDNVMVYSVIS